MAEEKRVNLKAAKFQKYLDDNKLTFSVEMHLMMKRIQLCSNLIFRWRDRHCRL